MTSMFRAGLFSGEVVLVTGGGTGIGLAAAREFGALGARMALCGRRPEPLAEAAKSLEAAKVEVHQAPCDIRDAAAVEAFVDGVQKRFGRVDVLVNNAGGQFPSAAETLSPRAFEAVVRNNLLGTWTMIHAVANRAMIPQRRGRIVNVIAQIVRGFPGMAHTGAARAGVENLTRTLAVEWVTHGIRVNAVAPGLILSTGTAQYPPGVLEEVRKATPEKRMGTPEEVARVIAFLASRQADFITGQTLYIDGGQSLWGDIWKLPDDVPVFPLES